MKRPAAKAAAEPNEAGVSVVEEEEDFPRGGSQGLTPLARRKLQQEAQAEAARDFAAESKRKKRKLGKQVVPRFCNLLSIIVTTTFKELITSCLLEWSNVACGAACGGAGGSFLTELSNDHLLAFYGIKLFDGTKQLSPFGICNLHIYLAAWLLKATSLISTACHPAHRMKMMKTCSLTARSYRGSCQNMWSC
jgi:hypothetical protein